ncbi:LysR family transcriptional regulator [Cryptosporangium phraense]|uniref:LysR family transcriptional regulator n=1 Tax=Cryptosporangium phraense TaxID=2593070 RepID=A0A545APS1_9ACTN|nr:LysR family transcriptional regulator [Cryptosporangium phraense]TQS43322.1 LysR family transcriptional regulator [Cryptosporangium phraense]
MTVDRMLLDLDLNLLVTLDALLRERNVTRAAELLGCSQPTMSTGLGRLRRYFDDELLHRVGNRYELTPLAVTLAVRTPPAIEGVRRVFDLRSEFDPAKIEREFTIVTSDYAAAVFGPLMTRRVAERAPGVRLRFQQTSPAAVDNAQDMLRSVDGILLPHGFLADVPHTDLFEDRWVCIVDRDNPTIGDTITLDQLQQAPWVVVFNRPTAFAPATQQLRMIGVEPRVEVVVDGFLQMPFMVAGTARVAMLQAHLASRLAEAAGVRVVECGFDVVPLAEAFWWHPMYRTDAAHTWLRELLVETAGELRTDVPDTFR